MTESLHDKDIREPLFDFLEEKYGKVRIMEEKQMGRSRADVVMVTESALCGIEIKSDADTYYCGTGRRKNGFLCVEGATGKSLCYVEAEAGNPLETGTGDPSGMEPDAKI
jgi:hypothetical protein